MKRKHRKPDCYGTGYDYDCVSCKYKEECSNETASNTKDNEVRTQMKCLRCKQEMVQDVVTKEWNCDNCEAEEIWLTED